MLVNIFVFKMFSEMFHGQALAGRIDGALSAARGGEVLMILNDFG